MNPNINQENEENNLNNNLINSNNQLNTITSDSDNDTEISTSSTSTTNTNSKFNLFNFINITKRIHSSQIDFDRTKKRKYKGLINEDEINKKEEKNIHVEYVNIFKIYAHLTNPNDWIYVILAVIGSIGAGISIPVLTYSTSEVYTRIGNTSENRDTHNNYTKMILAVKKVLNLQIKKQLLNGTFAFICYFTSIFFWSLVGNRCVFNLKRKYFTTILNQEQAWFDINNPFIISSNVFSELDKIEQGIGDKIGVIITLISQCVAGFIFAFISSWKLTLVMSCFIPFSVFIPNYLFILMRNGITLSRRTWGRAGGILEEMLYNIKTVASFANFEFELNKFYEKIEEVWKIDTKNSCRFGFAVATINICVNLCIFMGLIYGRTLISHEYNSNEERLYTGGDIIATVFCALFAISGISSIAPNIKTVHEACVSFSEYYNLYYRKKGMDFSKSIEKPPISELEGKIEFNGVSFHYPSDSNKKNVLDKISLLFEPGKKVALVGESGCGKTTIANLIERLYDINEGQLLIDGLEINRYDIEYLRSIIGYVQQEPVLFNRSIKDNIIFGREEYLKSMGNINEILKNVCEEVYINEFIDSLPGKLDYIVGINGSKLSGGQKQRIAIARAIITKPKILILDEATSSLDNKSEKEVQKALDSISQKNITTIIIAHRLSTIINSDLIYVIKNGNVLEKGNHKELLDLGGYYSDLFKNQLNAFKSKKNSEKKEIIEKNKKEEDIQCINKSNIALDEKDVSINPWKILKELSNYKLNLFLAICSPFVLGCITPIKGYIMAKGINGLNSKYEIVRYNDGLKYGLIFLLIAIIECMSHCFMMWKLQSLGVTLTKIYRKKILSKYLQLHLSYFDLKSNSPGNLVTKISIDTINLNQMLTGILGVIIQCSSIIILGILLGCIFEYRLTLIHFSFVPFIVFANVLRRTMINGQNKRGLQANINAGGIFSEFVVNSKTVFTFNFQKTAINTYLETIEYLKNNFVRDSIINGFFIGFGNFCSYAAYSSVFGAAKKFIIEDNLDSEYMSLATSIVTSCGQGLTTGFGNLGEIKKSKLAFKSIYRILGTQSLIPPFNEDNFGKKSANNLEGKIEFRHVFFSYPTNPESIVIKDLSMTILPGQHVALVGHSGSGKSTIIQLLSRFYDIEEGKGEILIDDINIKDYNLYELRKKIGLVSQEPSLFKTTVLENVRYGRLDATDQECIEAAKKANIMKLFTKERINEIIETSKPDKYSFHGPHGPYGPHGPHGPHSPHGPHGPYGLNNPPVGPHGSYGPNESIKPHGPNGENSQKLGNKKEPVSGGEKQRLAIARAFLKNPTILLLDEATSSLDKISEIEIQKSLETFVKNRTCISVAHRLSTIEKCDKIFVLDNGSIIEQGNHNELMKLGNKYYTLHKYTNMK